MRRSVLEQTLSLDPAPSGALSQMQPLIALALIRALSWRTSGTDARQKAAGTKTDRSRRPSLPPARRCDDTVDARIIHAKRLGERERAPIRADSMRSGVAWADRMDVANEQIARG